ncbi:MAG: translation initiation factor [Bacteroidales bacterium]|nr:translation initiation factor [Bacteroidales bacterium]
MKSNKDNRIVYSTDPNFAYNNDEEEIPVVSPEKQTLRISLDKKQRNGKKVTLITGFQGPEDALKDLAKILKTQCGVGGSVKDGEILIQGDFRPTVKALLEKKGYKTKVL